MTQICGQCKKQYKTRELYLAHTCSVTGFNPTQPEHMGERFIVQSGNALARTGSLSDEAKKDLASRREVAKDKGIT